MGYIGEGHLWGVWPIEKHCKAYDFEGWVKAVQKTDGHTLTICTSHDLFLCKELSFWGSRRLHVC